jgi:hypothetical protein
MGSLQAQEMRELVDENQALAWHLRHNHYPSIPTIMIPACKRALANARKGDYDKRVRLPKDVKHREHGSLVPTQVVMDYAHLWDFLEGES